jgi:hypothetical protein
VGDIFETFMCEVSSPQFLFRLTSPFVENPSPPPPPTIEPHQGRHFPFSGHPRDVDLSRTSEKNFNLVLENYGIVSVMNHTTVLYSDSLGFEEFQFHKEIP